MRTDKKTGSERTARNGPVVRSIFLHRLVYCSTTHFLRCRAVPISVPGATSIPPLTSPFSLRWPPFSLVDVHPSPLYAQQPVTIIIRRLSSRLDPAMISTTSMPCITLCFINRRPLVRGVGCGPFRDGRERKTRMREMVNAVGMRAMVWARVQGFLGGEPWL